MNRLIHLSPFPTAIAGSLVYSGGAGTDTIVLSGLLAGDAFEGGVTIGKNLKLVAGAGDNGVNLAGVNVGGATSYKGGAGIDSFGWFEGAATGNVSVSMGAGELNILLLGSLTGMGDPLSIGGKLAYKGGKGLDGALLSGVIVAGPTLFDFGAGGSGVNVQASAFEALTIKGKADVDGVVLTHSLVQGDAVFALGAGANLVFLDASLLAGNLLVKTGDGDDGVAFSNGTTVQGVQTLALGGGVNTVSP
jgi:hypothetical protein